MNLNTSLFLHYFLTQSNVKVITYDGAMWISGKVSFMFLMTRQALDTSSIVCSHTNTKSPFLHEPSPFSCCEKQKTTLLIEQKKKKKLLGMLHHHLKSSSYKSINIYEYKSQSQNTLLYNSFKIKAKYVLLFVHLFIVTRIKKIGSLQI